MTLPIYKFEKREQAYEAISGALNAATKHALSQNRRARLALSGGSTPEPAYTEFAKSNLDWGNVDIALVDDRWLDIDNDGSNEKMLNRAFSSAKGINIIGMKTLDDNPFDAVPNVDEKYKALRPFDAIILGMGNDAHTASWFAGTEGLEEILNPSCANTIYAINAEHSEVGKAYPLRMTLTLPPIAEAQMVILLIFGDDKLKVLENALHDNALSSPIKAAVDAAKSGFAVFWAK